MNDKKWLGQLSLLLLGGGLLICYDIGSIWPMFVVGAAVYCVFNYVNKLETSQTKVD